LRKKEETAMRKFLFLVLFALFPLKQAEAQSDSLIIELRDGQKFVPIKPIEIVFSDTLAFLYKGEILNVGIDDINKIIIARKSKFREYLKKGAWIGLAVGAIPLILILTLRLAEKSSKSSSRYIDLTGLAYALCFCNSSCWGWNWTRCWCSDRCDC
jgi:hypothetical protein